MTKRRWIDPQSVDLRAQVLCDLPAELSPAVQAFIGFVVLAAV